MLAYLQNDGQKEEVFLKEEMIKYVKQCLQQKELLGFSKRDFMQFAWSLCIVDRHPGHFDIYYLDKNGSVVLSHKQVSCSVVLCSQQMAQILWARFLNFCALPETLEQSCWAESFSPQYQASTKACIRLASVFFYSLSCFIWP